MLRQTFCHIPGIGAAAEKQLWEQGCDSWETLLAHPNDFTYSNAGRDMAVRTVEQSQEALARGEHQFFRKSLGLNNAWRAWPEFRSSCVYLDIETDGTNAGNAVTMVGLYDGEKFQCLVKGNDLQNFLDVISHYSMIVTFFGSRFDLPMLEKRFKGFTFDHLHMDLCFALRDIGYKGGLKKIEKQLGISRGDDTDGLTGLDAVRLWRQHQLGIESALERLIAYNREDVVNLETISEIAYKGLKGKTMPVQPRLL